MIRSAVLESLQGWQDYSTANNRKMFWKRWCATQMEKWILISLFSICTWYTLFQQFDYGDGSVCIQSTGWFIQKQHLGLNDQLHTDVGTLPLPSWNPTKKLRPNLHIEIGHSEVSWALLCDCSRLIAQWLLSSLVSWQFKNCHVAW